MKQLHHVETANDEKSVRAAGRRLAVEERKRLATVAALQRLRGRTETVLMDLKKTAALLDQSIEIELQLSPTRDPCDSSFSMSARALIARRDNLRATIASISKGMAQGNHF
jgi:hypothetical protein